MRLVLHIAAYWLMLKLRDATLRANEDETSTSREFRP